MKLRQILASALAGVALAGMTNANTQYTVTETRKRPMVVLDAGHGLGNTKPGVYDPGAVSKGVKEEEVVMSLTRKVGAILLKNGVDISYTRVNSADPVSFPRRDQIVQALSPEAYVSIHCNAAGNESARGVEVYCSNNGTGLGNSVYSNLVGRLKSNVSEFKERTNPVRGPQNFRVLKYSCPSILVETGFVTNPSDRDYLLSKQDAVAQGIADGIIASVKKSNSVK